MTLMCQRGYAFYCAQLIFRDRKSTFGGSYMYPSTKIVCYINVYSTHAENRKVASQYESDFSTL